MAIYEKSIVNDITNLNNQKRLNNLEHNKFCDECISEICTVRSHYKTFNMHLKTSHLLLIIDGEDSQTTRHVKIRKLLIRYNGVYIARQLPHSGLDLLYKHASQAQLELAAVTTSTVGTDTAAAAAATTTNTNNETRIRTPRMLSDRQDFYFHYHPFYLKHLIRLNMPDIEHPLEHIRHPSLDLFKW